MILYLYKLGTNTPALTIKNARSYTADSVTAEDGAVYRPLAEDYELSGKADCSETLRADYRAAFLLANPVNEILGRGFTLPR